MLLDNIPSEMHSRLGVEERQGGRGSLGCARRGQGRRVALSRMPDDAQSRACRLRLFLRFYDRPKTPTPDYATLLRQLVSKTASMRTLMSSTMPSRPVSAVSSHDASPLSLRFADIVFPMRVVAAVGGPEEGCGRVIMWTDLRAIAIMR